MRSSACSLAILALTLTTAEAATPAKMTLGMRVDGRYLEGMPLSWSSSQFFLLARDGRLWEFPPAKAKDYRKLSSTFTGYSASKLRGELFREFGNAFEVSGTGHYVVVHPRGQRNYWAQRFEDLYRLFGHYFSVRRFRVQSPPFPLVAVVFPSKADFHRFAARDGANISGGTLGYYSPTTNRILLYDVGGGGANRQDWSENEATLIHEATHQTAFNTGIHNRFTESPRWLVEGLATMFEARGVWNSSKYPRKVDRLNAGRLRDFKHFVSQGRVAGTLTQMVATDRMFRSNPAQAYAEAWALTFFLVETRPMKYADYLKRTAARENFVEYSSQQRLADFTAAFGKNHAVLEAQFLRYIAELK